jgi:hypothetical protein
MVVGAEVDFNILKGGGASDDVRKSTVVQWGSVAA